MGVCFQRRTIDIGINASSKEKPINSLNCPENVFTVNVNPSIFGRLHIIKSPYVRKPIIKKAMASIIMVKFFDNGRFL